MKKEMIVEFLRNSGFDEACAQDAYTRLAKSPQLLADFEAFVHTGAFPVVSIEGRNGRAECSVNGHTASELAGYGLSPIGAFLMLADISADPRSGEQMLSDLRTRGLEVPILDSQRRIVGFKIVSFERGPVRKETINRFCTNCGRNLPSGAKFCFYCGTKQL